MTPLLAFFIGLIVGALGGAATVVIVAVDKGQPSGDRKDWYDRGL